ncbi:hypothetical protein MNB_SM-3-1016 [hydrothermal vent metagenome]|uniref:PEGA domain-containing protein n=1 Tax=hydrothermal vent metagenome TaxID=652676 RepID=A0A1W1D4P2_9ZZZZ
MNKLLFLLFLLLPSLLSASIILEAQGSGESLQSAKKDALVALSSLIQVNINSSLTTNLQTSKHNKKEDVKLTTQDISTITTQNYLVGVKYEKLPTSKGVKVKAYLDDEALQKSIQTLYEAINRDVSHLSSNELEELLKKSEYLLVLIKFDDTIVSKQKVLALRDTIQKTLTMGQITLHILPKDVNIWIDNQKFQNDKTYFIAPTKHQIVIKKDGYLTLVRNFYIYKNHKITFHNHLMKKSTLPKTIAIRGAGIFLADIQSELSAYHIQYDKNSDYIISFRIQKQQIPTYLDVKMYKLQIVANLQYKDKLLVSKRGRLNTVVEMQLKQKELRLLRALIKAVLKEYSLR